MWTSVYMTQNIETARSVREKIEHKTLILMMRSIRQEERPGEDYFELLVPQAELDDALGIIVE